MQKIILFILLTTLLGGCVGMGDLIHFALPADFDKSRKKIEIEKFAKDNNLESKCTLEVFTTKRSKILMDLNYKDPVFKLPSYISSKKRKEQALNTCKKSDQTVSEQEPGE